jgi:hypothetical protein
LITSSDGSERIFNSAGNVISSPKVKTYTPKH